MRFYQTLQALLFGFQAGITTPGMV
eukprot:SAG31_NODE_14295_length_816_cov_0.885635_1_plen_24_part_10